MKILTAIIDEYIRTGEPVGSKALAETHDLKVSSATIRNTMAALEQEGYLDHPHTSAGRVPTFKGFRYYIDNLMNPEPVAAENISKIDEFFDESSLTDDAIIESASTALAEITKCAAISTNHASKFSVISKVDVIPTGRRMYVLLLITSNGAIKNKVCRMEFDLTDEQMRSFTEFLNEHLRGVNLENMSEEYVEKLVSAMSSYMLSLSPLLHAVYELSAEMMRDSVDVKGEANLLACGEIPAQDVMKFLEQKNLFPEMLDGALSGISVKFGEEEGTFAISNGAVVSANYYKDGKPAGTLGVIGPMRLDYRKVIPYIEYLSKKVTTLLSESERLQIESEEIDDNDE
ncbi:MAG: heat-inducible transcriptional repressor HrcA [Oscillospiraceae bacterium]|nr:heat-inducible transcriptional repressor HrcA [Oscillospiraceae bacterium]